MKLTNAHKKVLAGIATGSILVLLFVFTEDVGYSTTVDKIGLAVVFIMGMGLPWGYVATKNWGLESLLKIPFIGLCTYVVVRTALVTITGAAIMLFKAVKNGLHAMNPYR